MGTDLVKFRFLIFSGQFLTLGNRTPDPSEAEKLVGLGKKKKKKKITQTPPGEPFLEPIKNRFLLISAIGVD